MFNTIPLLYDRHCLSEGKPRCHNSCERAQYELLMINYPVLKLYCCDQKGRFIEIKRLCYIYQLISIIQEDKVMFFIVARRKYYQKIVFFLNLEVGRTNCSGIHVKVSELYLTLFCIYFLIVFAMEFPMITFCFVFFF